MNNIIEYLESTAGKYPNKLAVKDDKESCTYIELLNRSKAVGSALGNKTKGKAVAVFSDKSVKALCAFFGTVYSGGFYSLISPTLPANRIESIEKTLCPNAIITQSEYYDKAKKIFNCKEIYLIDELIGSEINGDYLQSVKRDFTDTNPLYVNFTSGSSGVPKGVVISHRSVIGFIDTFTEAFGINNDDVIANQAPFDFDVSVKDIYSCIKTGATLVIIPRELFSAPTKLIDCLCDNNATVMIWAVSALCLLSTFHALDYKTPQAVKKILFSGEVMPYKHLNAWRTALPDAMFVNLYGPTEVTCNCTYHILDKDCEYKENMPIGKPFKNQQVFLLDEDDNEVTAAGKTGEICVKSSNLALGYYNQSEQTKMRFVQNPLNKAYPEIIYRTGDIAKYNKNAELVFCGRKDFQIKYLGHRIELEEIENTISRMENIERCCCVFYEEKSLLTCFYVGGIERKELRENMRKSLPVFMMPNSIKRLEKMPITNNGKTDRNALKNGEYDEYRN